MTIRQPGWWISKEVGADLQEIKRAILEANGAQETGLERLVGVHSGVPFEVEVGMPWIERDDDVDHGTVVAILRRSPNLLLVITTSRGLDGKNPILVGQHEVLDEASYAVELRRWEREQFSLPN